MELFYKQKIVYVGYFLWSKIDGYFISWKKMLTVSCTFHMLNYKVIRLELSAILDKMQLI